MLKVRCARVVSAQSLTVFVPGIVQPFFGPVFAGTLEADEGGAGWRKVADFGLDKVPTTVSLPAVMASRFRLVLRCVRLHASLGSPAPDVAMSGPFGGSEAALKAAALLVGTFRLSSEPLVDRFETKAGFTISPDYHALPQPADDARGVAPGSVVDLTGRLREDGRLDWVAPKLPKGQAWRVLRLGWSLLGTTNHPATPEATGLEVDKYDGAAVRGYLEHYLGMYKDAAGPGRAGPGRAGPRGRARRARAADRFDRGGEANWTPRMLEKFRALRGYDAVPWLPTLTGTLVGTRDESATYSCSFTLPKGGRAGAPLWLDLGAVGDLAQVSVNGVDVGTAWHAPYRLDIGKALRRGSNRLEIRVANTWVSRLVGDAQKPKTSGAKPITWTAMPTYRADAPLRPSGLIGPVRLIAPGQ